MKKRYIAIISIASVGLLFSSLVYCGIKAFPELLEEEQEVKEEKHHRLVVETYVNQVATNDAPAVVVISDSPSTNGATVSDFTPSSYEGEVVLSFVKSSSTKSSHSHFKTPIKTTEEHLDGPVATFIDEPVITIVNEQPAAKTGVSSSNEKHFYGSYRKNDDVVINTNTVNKIVNNPVSNQHNTNKGIAECSLLVIGIVDLISILLIRHRKRRLFR